MIEAIKNKINSDSREDNGFTLIELIIVVVIIAILAAIAIPLYNNFQDNARDSAVDASAANGLTYATSQFLNGNTNTGEIEGTLNGEDSDIQISVSANGSNEGSICVEAEHAQGNTAQRGACDGAPATPED